MMSQYSVMFLLKGKASLFISEPFLNLNMQGLNLLERVRDCGCFFIRLVVLDM